MAHGYPDWTQSTSTVIPEVEEFSLHGVGDVLINNPKIEVGKTVKKYDNKFQLTVSAGGNQWRPYAVEAGLYDLLWLVLYSPGGNISHLNVKYVSFQYRRNVWDTEGYGISKSNIPKVTDIYYLDSDKLALWGPVLIQTSTTKETGYFINRVDVNIESDIDIDEELILDIFLRYAAAELTNIIDRPAYERPAVGKFDVPTYIDTDVSTSGYTTLIDSAGDYIKVIRLTVENWSSSDLTSGVVLYNSLDGTNPLWVTDFIAAHSVSQIDIVFPNGIYCNGVQLYCNSSAGSLHAYGCIVKVSTTPNPQVASVV